MTVTLDLDAASADVHTRRALYELSAAVVKKKKIVVVTGAGISCSCGIPDFRSSDGLYNMVKERYPDVVLKGRDLFDASLFRDTTSTSVFFSFIAELKKKIDEATPSNTHHFIKTLDSKNKLLRSYTQNIDGLEERVGLVGSSGDAAKSSGKGKNAGKLRVKEVRNVQLHGDIHRVRCIVCSAEFPCAEEHLSAFLEGTAPSCPECVSRSEARVARSARAIRVGSLRPAIVLYDEPHPLGDEIGAIQMADVSKKPDMLIIMGTSMKVHGLKQLVKDFAKTIHSSSSPAASTSSSPAKRPCKVIFVNKTAPSSEWADVIDYHVAGDTDTWVNKVLEDWKRIRPSDWEIQQTLDAVEPGFRLKKIATVGGAKKKVLKKKDENVAPEEPESHVLKLDNQPPSPSKRRQKASHYDELNSSPSKRQSVASFKGVMPSDERKFLFGEKTNQVEASLENYGEGSKMDISIAELSMQDLTPDVIKDVKKAAKPPARRRAPTAKAAAKAKLAGSQSKAVTTKPVARRRPKAPVAQVT
ncbi:hst3 protein [Ephemerocybe angulata]|uniref:Hst3 protein n=1 Tax=Ephemerocybe angulata TaxID=980116 RepID=A0A8H6IC65_9AGAR|nr:hst3 protein [Tulosesus angulatus]